MMDSQPNGLFIKIARVMGKVQAVSENETHGQGWKYAGDKAIYDAVRPYLAEEGLAIIPSIREISDDNGKMRVMFDIKLVCGETGEVLSSAWAAESFSKDDKGINKCATVAMKYFLKTTFLIATGDPNDDGDSNVAPKSGNQKVAQRPTERPAQPRTPPTPQQIRDAGNALDSEQSAQGEVPATNGNGNHEPVDSPRTPEQLREWFHAKLADKNIKGAMQGTIAEGQQKNIAISMSDYFKVETVRRDFLNYHFGSESRPVDSYAKLHEKEFLVLKMWLTNTDGSQLVKEAIAPVTA